MTGVGDERLQDTSYMLIAQRMVDEAILAWRADQNGKTSTDVQLDVALTPFPRLQDPRQANVGLLVAPIFINLAFTLPVTHASMNDSRTGPCPFCTLPHLDSMPP